MIGAFLYGATLAFGLIIPLGAQNIFIFNQGATQKTFLKAAPSFITAFLCDLALILLAICGISLVVLAIPWFKSMLFGIGILFLTYMGWMIWKNKSAVSQEKEALSLKSQILFALSVSILNPHAILDTIGVIGTNSLQFIGYDKIAFTLACLFTSFTWFTSLAYAGRVFHRVDQSGFGMILINKISALIMWALAIYLSILFANEF